MRKLKREELDHLINLQFKILAEVDEISIILSVPTDRNFKKNTFNNIQHLKYLKSLVAIKEEED